MLEGPSMPDWTLVAPVEGLLDVGMGAAGVGRAFSVLVCIVLAGGGVEADSYLFRRTSAA